MSDAEPTTASLETSVAQSRDFVFRNLVLIRLARTGLIVSFVLLAAAPLVIPDSYSITQHTLSESGAQGIAGAWAFRSGVLLASISVIALISVSAPLWPRSARRWLLVYAVAVGLLAVFPEEPWNGGPHDATVAFLHTVSGVIGAVAFIIGVFLVARNRPPAPALDWLVIAVVALVPQLMLLVEVDGLLQRGMVAIGYSWLLVESVRDERALFERIGPEAATSL